MSYSQYESIEEYQTITQYIDMRILEFDHY